MTTILVTEDNEMYSDSIVTSGDFILSDNIDKIENICGHLVGTAGRWSSCLEFREWFRSVCEAQEVSAKFPEVDVESKPVLQDNEDFYALVLSSDGVLTLFESFTKAYVVEKPYAIGSGSEYAMCALDASGDGCVAIEVAIKRYVYSGGEIQYLSLEDDNTTDGEAIGTISDNLEEED